MLDEQAELVELIEDLHAHLRTCEVALVDTSHVQKGGHQNLAGTDP
jgi:hypothetical protein